MTFGAPDEIEVGAEGIVGGGTKLTPAELHALVEEKDVVFFDGRNQIESDIGHFAGAVRPGVETTREFIAQLDSGAYDHLKDQPVVTYCTGGIRCEVLTPLMKNRGFQEVYQLDGGIATYGEAYGDDGLWKGSLYVFDDRITMDFSDHTALVGTCDLCGVADQSRRGLRRRLLRPTDEPLRVVRRDRHDVRPARLCQRLTKKLLRTVSNWLDSGRRKGEG